MNEDDFDGQGSLIDTTPVTLGTVTAPASSGGAGNFFSGLVSTLTPLAASTTSVLTALNKPQTTPATTPATLGSAVSNMSTVMIVAIVGLGLAVVFVAFKFLGRR